MKEKINIAQILENKSQGTKLYSLTYGDCFYQEYTGDFGIECQSQNGVQFNLDEYGKYCIDGECIIFPSKDMREWSKFAWKRGDVLVNSRGLKILFDRWANDNYTSFYAKTINLVEDGFLDTNLHTLASEKEAKSFIKCIEEKLGGKLNRETLKIEKAQPELKDGDIVVYKCEIDDVPSTIFIFRGISQRTPYYSYYASLDSDGFLSYKLGGFGIYKRELRLATEEEKKQLFEALDKEGKAWDAEKKLIVDLKPKCEFKPFDKVLCRNSKDDTWEADFFARLTRKEIDYTQSGKYLCVGDLWMYCIPYNEETAHLLGTTDEWKGGEGEKMVTESD